MSTVRRFVAQALLAPIAFAAPLAAAAGQLAPAAPVAHPSNANTDVPVTKVMLFSSGVGYFEHAGTVHGNGSTELRFKTSQINDILKSLMLQDQDGGRVGTITYPSQDPLSKTLRSFQVDITRNPSLADLLNQLRGARVTVQAQGEHVSGTILGVEMRQKPAEKGEPIQAAMLNVLTGAMIRTIDLGAISNLSLDDAQLQEELTRALAALAQARDQDKKPVTINFTGAGDRHVRIGYVVETPIWKTSYRLMLGDKPASGSLQGWAIVENETESDWNGVSLSLVSGRPISFTMDLYQPLYSTRPAVVPELFAGLKPQLYDAGNETAIGRTAMPSVESPEAKASAPRRIGSGPDGRPSAMQLQNVTVTGSTVAAMDLAESVASIASTAKLGELFEYSVPNVTLARQKSAMLPIVTDTVHIERVSIYNSSALRSNPLNGVWLKNTTGKHLLQGPVTVLDRGGYAGDARIDNVPPGQDRLLSYGVDLDMTIDDTKSATNGAVVTVKIDRGALVVTRKMVASIEYAANNKSSKDKMLVIEHHAHPGWKLVDSQKPFETTPALYRFKGVAAANKITTLVVNEEMVTSETYGLATIDLGQLAIYSRTGEIPSTVRDAMNKAMQLRQSIADLDRQIAARTQHIAEITAEQNRIRENMKTVASTSQYYTRLLEKLNEQESSIEHTQAERDGLSAKRDAARRDLNEYLSTLTIG